MGERFVKVYRTWHIRGLKENKLEGFWSVQKAQIVRDMMRCGSVEVASLVKDL